MEITIGSLGVALVIGMVCSAWIVSIDLKAIRNELREQRQYLRKSNDDSSYDRGNAGENLPQ